MKLYHYCVLFVIIAIALFTITDIKTNNYIAVASEKEQLDQSFSKAIDDATAKISNVDNLNDDLTINKENALDQFYLSLYAALGIPDDPIKQEDINNYMPVVAVTCKDGFYVYIGDQIKNNDNYTYIHKRWSEKLPFYYEDDDFIYGFTLSDTLTLYDKNVLLDISKEQRVFTLDYHELSSSDEYANFRLKRPDSVLLNDEKFYLLRKNRIINCIENTLSFYCNKYNLIAQQYGISYNFSMPVTDKTEWLRSIDNPCLIVVFQGYPYGNGINDTYNRFAIAGSQIKKDTVYYIEQKNWYFIYHKANCPELKKDGILLLTEPYYTILDCVKKGAYACPQCSPDTGVYAPDYTP